MNRDIKRSVSYVAAVVIGMLAFSFVASTRADNPKNSVTMCYRGNTIVVDHGDVQRYLRLGATVGACATSS